MSATTAPETKSFNGDFLLFRKDSQGMRKMPKGSHPRPPRFRHKKFAEAEAEATRLLVSNPDSTFIVLQEVARIKLKPVSMSAAEDWLLRWRGAGEGNGIARMGKTVCMMTPGREVLSSGEGALIGELNSDAELHAMVWQRLAREERETVSGDNPPTPMKCRRVGCQRMSTHASGMCDEHQPGFAQADDQEQAA